MNPSQRKADVLVYDVSRVLHALRDHPVTEILKTRIMRHSHTGHGSLCSRGTMGLLQIAHGQLVDDFMKHAINSYQEVWIMGYDPSTNTEQERQWFHLNTDAWQLLWEIIRVDNRYAGSMVGFTRINNLVYLYVPTT